MVNGKARRCECYKAEIARKKFLKSGINPQNTHLTFSNFKVWNDASKQMKSVAIQYYKDFNEIKREKQNSLALLGQVGSGKTHATTALALNLMENKKVEVIYMRYREVATALKQNTLDKSYYQKEVSKYKKAELLLIDDLLKGKSTDADKNILVEIIDHRYLNRLPIIISSEQSITDIMSFDEGTGTRIREMCMDYTVEIEKINNNNYRIKDLL